MFFVETKVFNFCVRTNSKTLKLYIYLLVSIDDLFIQCAHYYCILI